MIRREDGGISISMPSGGMVYVRDSDRATTDERALYRLASDMLAAPQPGGAAAAKPAVPEGWQWAPMVPTESMKLAGWKAWEGGGDRQHRVYVAMLAAAPQPEKPAVPEARLQWSEHREPNSEIRYDHVIASTPFGRFVITWKSWKKFDSPTVDETPWGDFMGAYSNVEEAKRACEAEYTNRLLRATAPQPGEG